MKWLTDIITNIDNYLKANDSDSIFGKILQIPLNLKRKEGSSEGNILAGDSNHPGELYSSMEY